MIQLLNNFFFWKKVFVCPDHFALLDIHPEGISKWYTNEPNPVLLYRDDLLEPFGVCGSGNHFLSFHSFYFFCKITI